MTTLDENHAMMVAALIKPGEEIIAETTPLKAHLNHMAMLLAGEAGEVVDAIKKHTIYGKDLDFVNVIEELGDIEFALEAIRSSLTIHRDETLAMNMEKLAKRYPHGNFSNADAQSRADKETGTGYIEVNVDPAKPGADKTVKMNVTHIGISNDETVVSNGFFGEASEFDNKEMSDSPIGVFLQYYNGQKWIPAGGPYGTEHAAWRSLGRDTFDHYRTVSAGAVLTDNSQGN
tara:strand:- start:316 stop:1011 length:696 start_codon:yes stop_codon:yes gene_type:complete